MVRISFNSSCAQPLIGGKYFSAADAPTVSLFILNKSDHKSIFPAPCLDSPPFSFKYAVEKVSVDPRDLEQVSSDDVPFVFIMEYKSGTKTDDCTGKEKVWSKPPHFEISTLFGLPMDGRTSKKISRAMTQLIELCRGWQKLSPPKTEKMAVLDSAGRGGIVTLMVEQSVDDAFVHRPRDLCDQRPLTAVQTGKNDGLLAGIAHNFRNFTRNTPITHKNEPVLCWSKDNPLEHQRFSGRKQNCREKETKEDVEI
nr:hypothetical protein Iba_chr15aCG3280 [Ipomoea batatas]